MYKVVHNFKDLETDVAYFVGDKYPKTGTSTAERLEELSSNKNRAGMVLIARDTNETPETETPKKKTRKKKGDDVE